MNLAREAQKLMELMDERKTENRHEWGDGFLFAKEVRPLLETIVKLNITEYFDRAVGNPSSGDPSLA